jgi:hypothetical protein
VCVYEEPEARENPQHLKYPKTRDDPVAPDMWKTWRGALTQGEQAADHHRP